MIMLGVEEKDHVRRGEYSCREKRRLFMSKREEICILGAEENIQLGAEYSLMFRENIRVWRQVIAVVLMRYSTMAITRK